MVETEFVFVNLDRNLRKSLAITYLVELFKEIWRDEGFGENEHHRSITSMGSDAPPGDDSIILEVNGEHEQHTSSITTDSDTHDSLVPKVNGDAGELETSTTSIDLEVSSPNGEAKHEFERAHEILTRLDLDLASTSEKLINLSILMFHISQKENEFEPFSLEKDDAPMDTVEMALEFDLLFGIFDSEVKNVDDFVASVESEIAGAREIIAFYRHLGEALLVMQEKLENSEESLKQSRLQLEEMKRQSAKFQRIVANLGSKEQHLEELHASEDGDFFNADTNITMQTSEQQRNVLRMLEKSLARELDLEKKLAESKQTEAELKLRLHYSAQEVLSAKEDLTVISQRFLEADNLVGVLTGVMKDLMSLIHSKAMDLQGETMKLKDEVAAAELRAESADAVCKSLEEANIKLNLEMKDKASAAEKADSLEKQLREAAVQLQHAAAAMDASQEKQIMLSTTINDMENLIENLKPKVLKAEDRAENAEEQCIVLSEINEELHKEVDHLRGRLENLDASRQRTEEAKAATAKDIGFRTKMIADLVLQLGVERERLRSQLYSLVKENRFLIEKLQEMDKRTPPEKNHDAIKEVEVFQPEVESVAANEPSSIQGEPLEDETEYETVDAKANLETVRTIDIGRLGYNFLLLAIFGLMVALLAICFVQQGSYPS
ncbi:WPP domain-interacting tail-anchored protein 1-like protein [Drosera capensis]